MVLAFTSPTDDIIFHEGVSAYNFKASGTIKGGQLVFAVDTMEVKACDAEGKVGVIGVAAYDVTDDEYVAVFGKGNIVRCKSSGAIVVGDTLTTSAYGGVNRFPTLLSGARIDRIVGKALETVATDTQVRVLLY
jgi:translation elongation factor EF-G